MKYRKGPTDYKCNSEYRYLSAFCAHFGLQWLNKSHRIR